MNNVRNSEKKLVVLCHRLVLLEQLEKGLSTDHKVKKLGLSERVNLLADMMSLFLQILGLGSF